MEREPDDDDAMDPQRAARMARNRHALRAVAENERATRKKTPGAQGEGFADDERSTA
jgi:hypothetical protein